MPGMYPDAVLAFVFGAVAHRYGPYVALVTKSHPDWQKGYRNGLGGKVEAGEDPIAAVVREVKEEAGLDIPAEQWRRRVRLYGRDGYCMWVYAAYLADQPRLSYPPNSDEPVFWFDVDKLPADVLPNLRWLIPLCLDGRVVEEVEIQYRRPPEDAT